MENLLSCLDLDPDRIAAGFAPGQVGAHVLVFAATTSTIDVARRVAADPTAGGTVIVADTQRSGRGRHGRSWHSPPGAGIWASLVADSPAREPGSLANPSWLAVLVTMATVEALRGLGWRGLGIRWPNDVVERDAGRKVAGALAEIYQGPGAPPHCCRSILSLGLNVKQTAQDQFPVELRATAASLAMLRGRPEMPAADAPLDRGPILRAILQELNRWLGRPPEGWLALWDRHSVLTGQMVQVRSEGESWEGQVAGLEPDGSLLVRVPSGQLRRLQSGDVELLRPAAAAPPAGSGSTNGS